MVRVTHNCAFFVMTAALVAAFAVIARAGQFPQWGELEAGPFATGFKVVNTYDASRPATALVDDKSKGRPIQISIWYPANPVSHPTYMKYGDYVRLTATELNFDRKDRAAIEAAEASFKSFPLNEEMPDELLRRVLDMQTASILNAGAAAGRFPVLVVAQGNHGPSYHHSILAEYLASHGYIVATNPSGTRYVSKTFNMSADVEAFQSQIDDIIYVTEFMTSFPNADTGHIMLQGFSMGGNTGGLAMLLDDHVAGFVCTDCGVGSKWGTPSLLQAPELAAAKTREVAFLNMHRNDDEKVDYSFIDAFENSASHGIAVSGVSHYNFTSLGMLAGLMPGIVADERWLVSADGVAIYEGIARYVLHFLDAYQKGDVQAVGFLTGEPATNGLAADKFSVVVSRVRMSARHE